MSHDLPDVRPGDVWKDNDPRGGPTVVVEKVCDRLGCVQRTDALHAHVTDTDGKRHRTIQLRRFRPNRRGYRLISRKDVDS